MTPVAEGRWSRAAWGGGADEARLAVLSAAALYVVGATLTGTAALLPAVGSPVGVGIVAGCALLTAAVLILAARMQRASLLAAFVADLWGVVLVATLCASTDGAHSPFALIYYFAIGHAAAFQPRGRLAVVSAASLAGFLSPLAYEHVSLTFGAAAAVGMVLALLTGGVVHYALDRVRVQRRLLESLVAATSGLDNSLDPAATARRIARTAVPELADLCVVHLVGQDPPAGGAIAVASSSALAQAAERAHLEAALDPRAAPARALHTGSPCVLAPGGQDPMTSSPGDADDPLWRFMRSAGYRGAAVFPMIARGRTHGTVSFLHRAGRQARDASRLAALEDLTSRAAIAYDNARLYAERARVARTLRRSLMPAGLPSVPGIELASFFRPVGAGEEVGGDFFDVFRHGHCCWLVVGDVCGKGAEAAALTAFLRHTTMAYARDAASPSHVLRRVNQAMLEQDFDGRFATMLLARLEPIGAGVEALLASGGHPPALRARLDGEVQQVGTNGTLLGVFDDPAIGDATVLLGPGDMLALYTDGLIDAHAPGRTVTVAEMAKRLRGSLPRRSEEVVEALLALVDLDAGVRDDIAILAAQVDPLIARDPHSSDAAARHRAVSRSGRVRGAAE